MEYQQSATSPQFPGVETSSDMYVEEKAYEERLVV